MLEIFTGSTNKTISKHIWRKIDALELLAIKLVSNFACMKDTFLFHFSLWNPLWTQIRLEYSHDETLSYEIALVIDGVDCRIEEPLEFSKGWYSFKFEGPGVRYETGSSI